MKIKTNPIFVVVVCGALLFGLGIFFGVVPLVLNIDRSRQEIDTTRTFIETIKQQQRDINRVSQNFSEIDRQQKFLASQFLDHSGAVEFYNLIDDLFNSAEITDRTVRVDTPAINNEWQLIGIHFTFSASYQQAIVALRKLGAVTPLISIDTVSINRPGNATGQLAITLDGQIPWRNEK